MMKSRKAICAGHICLDITPVFPPEKAGTPGELLIPGTLLRMDGVDVHTGGSVANTGLAMKLLGADVRLMGKIGGDAFGGMLREILTRYGCDPLRDTITDPDGVTSYSVVLAVPGSDRIFLHAPGTNDTFGMADIDFRAVEEANLFHFGYPPLMRRIYENEGAELLALFRRVKDLGLATSLDMAAVDPETEAGRVNWKCLLEKLVPLTDFFLPSAEELYFMLNGRRLDGHLDMQRDVLPMAEEVMEMGAGVLVIKCGEDGMLYRTGNAAAIAGIGKKLELDVSAWAGKEGIQKCFRPERVCSATGAGDTSIAAFLTAVLDGKGPGDCIRLAAAEGACCVEAYDALGGLKSLEELEKKIAAGWAEL